MALFYAVYACVTSQTGTNCFNSHPRVTSEQGGLDFIADIGLLNILTLKIVAVTENWGANTGNQSELSSVSGRRGH